MLPHTWPGFEFRLSRDTTDLIRFLRAQNIMIECGNRAIPIASSGKRAAASRNPSALNLRLWA
jgi:hypothetical protein